MNWPAGMLSLTASIRAESFCLSKASCLNSHRFCSFRSQIFLTATTMSMMDKNTTSLVGKGVADSL